MTAETRNANSQKLHFDRVISAISVRKGVKISSTGESISILIDSDRGSSEILMGGPSDTYALQKQHFADLRDILTSLGIKEGASYTPPPLPKRGMTPIIQKSRAEQRQEFEAWQNVWRRIRAAEKNLDLEFELKQMMDYY